MISKNNSFDLQNKSLDTKRYAFTFIALFVVLIIIYGNSFQNTWHFDDLPNIVENRNVHLKSLAWNSVKKSFYGIDQKQQKINRPLSYFSFALNHYFGGTSVFGYHLVNFVILYLTAIFLFMLLYNTLQLPVLNSRYKESAYAIATLAVFFWATHPIQVTAVTYIVQRMASMAGMFYAMSIYFYLKFWIVREKKNRIGFLVLSLVAAVFAIASKENAVMLPLSILLYDALLLQGVSLKRLPKHIKILIPLILLLAVLLLMNFLPSALGGYHIRPYTLYERLLTEPRVIVFYLSLLFYPTSSRLALLHDVEVSKSLLMPWTTLAAILIILLVIGIAFWIRRKRPLIAYSVIFFFLNHLIEGSIVSLELIFEHRNYIPSMFLFVLPAVACIKIIEYFSYRKPLQLLMSFTVIFLLIAQGHTTYIRNDIFSNDLTLWNDNVKKAPNLSRPHHNLGKALLAAGLYEDSLREMHRAISAREGAKIDQQYKTYHNLGIYYLNQNEYDKALGLFFKSLGLQPNNYKSFLAIATIMLYRNSINLAEQYIGIALRLNSYHSDTYFIRGLIWLKKGDIDAAIKSGEKALQLNQNDHKSYFLIAEAYRLKHKLTQSVYYFKKYSDRYPEQSSAYLALIELYYLLNNQKALKQSVSILMNLIDNKKLSEIILTYHEKDNYLDDSRVKRIVQAIDETISLQSGELNRLLKTIER